MNKIILQKYLKNLLFLMFCGVILLLSVKGIPGNPSSKDLVKPEWSKDGPLEPSVEGGRFALTYSLIENHSLTFSDNLALLATPDLGYKDGKYVSLFAPGLSVLSIPGYLLGKLLGASQVGTFATAAFFALLNVYLLRKIAIRLGSNSLAASLASITFIFASPAFAYATTLYQHHISTFLILLSVYLLIRYNNFKSLFAFWIIYGLGFIVDYPNIIMMLPIAIFAITKTFLIKKQDNNLEIGFSITRVFSILGIILPVLIMFWYNQNANGGPFKLSGTLDSVTRISDTGKPVLASEVIKEAIKNKKMTQPPAASFFTPFQNRHMINGLYVHFLSIDRGMIFFTPIMLFGIIGVIYSLRKLDKNTTLLIAIMAFNVLLYSMWDDPQGGWAFGSRYLIPTYAILSIFIARLLSRFKKNNLFLVMFFIILSYSVAVNTLGALTPTTNPPKAEAIALEKQYHQKQKYTYLRNVDFINKDDSKSFVFQTFAVGHVSAWDYYLDLTILILIAAGFYLACFAYYPNDKLVESESFQKNNRGLFDSSITVSYQWTKKIKKLFEKQTEKIIIISLSIISVGNFIYYYLNGLGLAYNDARSHLDIGRRVVESIKPGFAQLGSVWLPLPHLMMALTIWNDFMWHSGLSGAIQSMASYVATGLLIYLFLKKLGANMFGRITGVLVFALNLNILYMQSTAMTELFLIAAMMAGVYQLMIWHQTEKIFDLIKAGFWIMLSTLIRYDGWFLFVFAVFLVFIRSVKRRGYKTAEGVIVMFAALSGFGIFLWLFWNLMIFKDPLYFAFGSYSANAQQKVIEQAGYLSTKHNLLFSIQSYIYAVIYNSDILTVAVSTVGAIVLWFDKKIEKPIRVACLALLSPLFFNIIALYVGHSVLFVQGLGINSWFNVRYGLMMVPTIAIFVGYLINRMKSRKFILIGLMVFVSAFAYINHEAVTLDDAIVGLGGKNVTQVSGYLHDNALDKNGFVLLSAARHDAIIFSSGLPMKRIIHEGTGLYWDLAIAHPDKWARWVVMRTNDPNDLIAKLLRKNKAFKQKYTLVRQYPFADVYELKDQYVENLNFEANLANNK